MSGSMRTQRRRGLAVAVAVLVGASLAAGCGSSASSSGTTTSQTTSGGTTISTGTVTGLGTVLVNAQGLTLYVFAPDKHASVTCTGACASVWPPVQLTAGQTAVAAGGAKQTLLGSDPIPGGGRVVTYSGWPLYTYVADTAAGVAQGQALPQWRPVVRDVASWDDHSHEAMTAGSNRSRRPAASA